MGACAGKNKSKAYKQESESTAKPKSKKKDDRAQSNSSSAPKEDLPSSNGTTVKNEQNGNNGDIQGMIDQNDEVNKAIRQIFAYPVTSVTDSELEVELANLVYGHPERDYAENLRVATTFKSTEV